jgi:threonine dehydrogenase-like Zn-dependent dehydrogenase
MLRVIKPEGFGNVQLEEVPIPDITSRQVLVRAQATLISRGSELFARYIKEEAVSPNIMGYSLTGVVERVGDEVTEYQVGDRVMVVAPHAQYAVGNVGTEEAAQMVVPLPDGVSFEEGTFLPLATSALAWAESAGVKQGDTVVILGQGLVGSLMLQVLRERQSLRLIAVDALPLRCQFVREFGADVVINSAEEDPVQAVRQRTNGKGAEVVIDCVGGHVGVQAFEQAQDMVQARGTLMLISLYHGAPLPLHASKIMNRRLIAGIHIDEPRSQTARRAAEKIRSGAIQAKRMITHCFPFTQAKQAFDLLWEKPDEALGVILIWE